MGAKTKRTLNNAAQKERMLLLYYKPHLMSLPLFFTCISQNSHGEKNKPNFLTSLSKQKYFSRITTINKFYGRTLNPLSASTS